MKIIYKYLTDRNKFKLKGKTASTLKRKLSKERGNICYLCKKEFGLTYLQLEHKIPVMVGGHLFKDNNIELCCSRCHVKKTSVDKRIIHIMKKIGVIKGRWQISATYNLDKTINIYKELLEMVLDSDTLLKCFNYGKYNIDYIYEFQEENRK